MCGAGRGARGVRAGVRADGGVVGGGARAVRARPARARAAALAEVTSHLRTILLEVAAPSHSRFPRRVTSVAVNFHVTQLFGCDGTEVSWQVPQGVRPPSPLTLAPAHTCSTQLRYPLPSLPNEYPETNIIT